MSSRWDRYEKNFPFVRALIEACPELRTHVVGHGAPPVGTSVRHGLLTSRAELFALMGRARAIVCPSLFDAAPGVLFEADALGCNIVASRNCGNWTLCAPELLVEERTVAGYVNAARAGAAKLYARDTSTDGQNSYALLLDICAVC